MTGAPIGAKIKIFEIFKIMKMLKNCFNKITTWKSDQEEFYISESTSFIEYFSNSEFQVWSSNFAPTGAPVISPVGEDCEATSM